MIRRVIETFQIDGRGLVVVVDGTSNLPVGRSLPVEIETPRGQWITTVAYREWPRREAPLDDEHDAYLLEGLRRDDVPVGSILRF